MTVAEPAVVYRSLVRVEPAADRAKRVWLPGEHVPVTMGFHGELAPRFGLVEGAYEPAASTLDYVVGAAAACMTGVFAAGLKARGIAVDAGRLSVDAVGEVELEDVLVLRRINVVLHLRAAEKHRAAAERLAATFERQCPVYRSISPAIEIASALDFVAGVD